MLFKIAISWLKIWNEIVLNSTKLLFFKLIFILQLIMQNFLRQCLITKSTKFVVENSLLLLFIELFVMRCEFVRKYIWLKMIKSFDCCFFLSIFANQFLLKQYKIFAIVLNAISFVTFTISIDFDWMFINVIKFEFFIVFSILNYIAFVRFLDRRKSFLLKSSCDFSTWIFCYVFVEIIDSINFWCFDSKTKWSKSLFSNCFSKFEYNKFILNKNSDKLRKFVQSFWCFWFVVIVMNNQKFEMIDVCR